MTNNEIILNEMLLRGITEECHTFAKWKSLGYTVIRGQKATFQTAIWKYVNKEKSNSDSNDEDITIDGKDSEVKMFLKTASFFTKSQVKKIEKTLNN